MSISNHPQGDVVDSQLIVAGGQGAAPLEPTHHPLDDVAPTIGVLVEVLLTRLILAGWNHRLHVVPSQPGPYSGEAVALVGGGTLRPAFAARLTRSPRPLHGLLEAFDLVTLTLGHPHGQEDAPAVTDQMRLGAEASLGTPQRMSLGLYHLRRLWPAQPRRLVRIFFSPRRQPPRPD